MQRRTLERDHNEHESEQEQRNREHHSHCEAAPEESKLRIRLAEQLAERARDRIAHRKKASDQPGSLQGARADADRKQQQKAEALQRRFIELAWMARQRTSGRKRHRPWHV